MVHRREEKPPARLVRLLQGEVRRGEQVLRGLAARDEDRLEVVPDDPPNLAG